MMLFMDISESRAVASGDTRYVGVIPRDQLYYWTPEWQAGEREADEDIAAGRTRTFETWAEAEAWLLSDDEDE